MDGGEERTFNDKNEEIIYWKQLAVQYMEEADRIQHESDEFLMESQQLDKEYEATIDQNEKKIKDLSIENVNLHNELEHLKQRLDQINKDNQQLQDRFDIVMNEKLNMNQYIRELEQKNDDLERSRRIIEESISGIEQAFHNAIERNAILELEVDEKEGLKEKLQRLADETRDLKQELMVKERVKDNDHVINNGFKNYYDTNRLKENETQTTPIKKEMNGFSSNLSPSSRLMAVNIVSDLIRKVGDLERRLEKSCYEIPKTNELRNRLKSTNSQGLSK